VGDGILSLGVCMARVESERMKLYVKSRCPWCVDARDWLDGRSIAYSVVDVLDDRVAFARMREISGQSLTPTLEMPDGEVLADFDTGQLEKFLKAREAR